MLTSRVSVTVTDHPFSEIPRSYLKHDRDVYLVMGTDVSQSLKITTLGYRSSFLSCTFNYSAMNMY